MRVNPDSLKLTSHTVKANKGYTLDPFLPVQKDGKIIGLGSNDAGGLPGCIDRNIHLLP
jgi:acetylornithine deacetylase